VAKEANAKINKITIDGKSVDLNNLYDWCLRRWNELNLAYDKETNHSLNKEKQYYWEYKIDSLYTNNDTSKSLKDEYSGISCYFPSMPKQEIHVDSFLLRKVHHTHPI